MAFHQLRPAPLLDAGVDLRRGSSRRFFAAKVQASSTNIDADGATPPISRTRTRAAMRLLDVGHDVDFGRRRRITGAAVRHPSSWLNRLGIDVSFRRQPCTEIRRHLAAPVLGRLPIDHGATVTPSATLNLGEQAKNKLPKLVLNPARLSGRSSADAAP